MIMNKFIASICLLLCLTGCERGRTVVVHAIANGHDVVYSQVHVIGQLATFRCLRSESGQCHYTVVADDCAPASTACSSPPKRFTVGEGNAMSFTSLPPGFRSCVAATAAPDGDCAPLAAAIASASP
jgi:hypothetical protein